MAADALGSLFIDLSMRTAQFDAATKRVEAQVAGMGARLSSAFTAMKGIAASAAVVIGVQAAQAATSWAHSMAAAGEAAENLATTLGLTLEQVVKLQGVFQLTTGTLGEAQAAMLKMNGAVQDALGGSKEAIENFRMIGVTLADLARVGNDPMEMLKLLADRFQAYEDNAAKSAAFFDIFGKGWAKLAPVLAGGRAEVEKLEGSLQDLDPAGTEAARAGAELDKAFDTMHKAIDGVINQAFVPLMPLLKETAERTTEIAKFIRDVISAANDALAPIGGLGTAVKTLADQLIQAINPLYRVYRIMQAIGNLRAGLDQGDTAQILRDRDAAGANADKNDVRDVTDPISPTMTLPTVIVKGSRPSVGTKAKGGGGGGGKNEAVEEWKEAVELMEKMAEELKDATIASLEGAQDISDELFTRRLNQIRHELAIEKISGREAVDAERKVAEEKWAAHQEFFRLKREAAAEDKKEIARLDREEALARERHLTALQGLDHDKTKLRFDDLKSLGQDVANVLENSFSNVFDGLTEGTFKFRNALAGLLKDFGRLAASTAFKMLLTGGTGSSSSGGGLLGSLFSWISGSTTKAATGGNFRVAGAGGIDSQFVGMALTPGELVEVTPPGRGGGGHEVIEISLTPNEAFVAGVADRRVMTASGRIVQISVAQSVKAVQRNFNGLASEAQARQELGR